ncbi:MAG: DNA polymerase III subunit alpha [Patescibacteria group bacterium]|jgi:DNA polymerase-3 subunit alpha
MSDATAPIQKSPFVHLHTHSMYSLLDAMGDAPDLVARAKELGYDALALTDHAGLYGAIEFYEACHKAGIKPILGVEAYVAPNKHTDKRPRIDDQISHITLLAETNEGYRNLLHLVSRAFLDGFYYKPRMDKDLFREYGKGIIALSGCLRGEIPKAVVGHDMEKAAGIVRTYQDIFGKDNFFLEVIHSPEAATQVSVNEGLFELAEMTGAPLVATKNVHYLRPDDADAQDALQCIHDGKMLSDNNRYSMSGIDHSLSPPGEMVEAFANHPEAVLNTRKIADRCNVTLELGKNLLPTFDVPEGKTPKSYLRELCEAGLIDRYPSGIPPEAVERLTFELETIGRMGFEAYFLIVQDYVNWAKNHGVIVGPGRGSAAGSVVAYSLKITNIDPLQYGLLFERFLNPDRISMPDIDLDFDDVKRKDVIEYVSQKYGRDRVAGIITFGTMAARAAVRDVARVLGWTFQEVDRVAKAIPPPVQGRHIPLNVSIIENPELRAMYEGEPRVKQLIDLAIKLEGTARHASQHACGIVIAPRPLVEFAPLQKAQGGDVEQVIQYSLHSTEVSGLLKMDFLGLSNLTVIRDAIEIIKAVHGVDVDIEKIPLNDQATFELLGRGETTGVFQLESDGMKKYIRELKPTVIEDIIAMVALYRPGPMQFIESFIDRKHGREKITYAHPLLENALGNTYGIPVYQEQVMQVSKDMAGFTGGEADTLRKAMGKKIAKLMAEMREKFIAGSVKNGVEKHVAEGIFQQFEEFAAYGFNKSHAACYAMIAYQTAYLKAYWPASFMAALLNSDSQNLDRITIEVEECRRINLEVLPPDINESFAGFSVVKDTNKIRFGLQAIKGLGEDVVQIMVTERKKDGSYKSLEDFVARVPGRAINKKSLECLIRSGALDRFGDRNTLFFNIDGILEHHKRVEQEASSGQFSLFASSSPSGTQTPLNFKPAPPASKRELLAWEKELLGLYVSEHPFREYGERLLGVITPIVQLRELKAEKKVRVAGVITSAKKILTKKNEPMMFCKLEDQTGDTEIVIFPRVLRDNPALWMEDRAVMVTGRPSEKEGRMNVLVETGFEITPQNIEEIRVQETSSLQPGTDDPTMNPIPPMIQDSAVTLCVRAKLPDTILVKLRAILDAHPGDHVVYFLIDDVDGPRRIKSSSKIAFNDAACKELEGLLGRDTVKIGR